MRALFDTNALLWWCFVPDRLTGDAMQAMDDAQVLAVSAVSLWEIGLKLSRGGFDFVLPEDWEIQIPEHCRRHGMSWQPIEPGHCKRIASLPFHHRDPFDRMLIAQALVEQLAVIGADPAFDLYGVDRVW